MGMCEKESAVFHCLRRNPRGSEQRHQIELWEAGKSVQCANPSKSLASCKVLCPSLGRSKSVSKTILR
jgi:hypothetical protein